MAKPKPEAPAHPQAYGATGSTDQPITSHYELQKDVLSPTAEATYDRFDDEEDNEDEMDDPYDMSLTELLYSSSSYHAIAKPGEYSVNGAVIVDIFVPVLMPLLEHTKRIWTVEILSCLLDAAFHFQLINVLAFIFN